jgi:putative ATPase
MQSLFEDKINLSAPLASRMRPVSIDDIAGQQHLLGKNAPLRKLIDNKSIHSMLLWGPPGVGKTTIALALATELDYNFIQLSAIEAGVKQVREVIKTAENHKFSGKETILFIDEIHRFNKSQQDALLKSVENGTITLIGATTENPSFEVNPALLSRCQVYKLKELEDDDIKNIIHKAITNDARLSKLDIEIADFDFLLKISAGDARTALNALDLSVKLSDPKNKIIIDKNVLSRALQQKTAQYDKKGDNHYDTISAFIKSMRGSDPDAAIFWLAKMLDAGEDAKFIARRMVIFASEDVGNADVYAITLANEVFRAVEIVGLPEARINLAQGVTYLASCPKSNASYLAINEAMNDISEGVSTEVPLHLRNAPTKLMKKEGYGREYKYPHDFPGSFVPENYFPEKFKQKKYYNPGNSGKEKQFKERLNQLWKERE